MNRRAQIRRMQARISTPQKEPGIFCHADRERALCNPFYTPSPGSGSFAGRGEGDAEMRNVCPSILCFCSRESGRLRNMVSLLSGCRGVLIQMPFRGKSPSSANSPVFSLPASGHSLGAGPAPGGNCAALLPALRVSVSRKSFAQRTRKTFSRPSEKAPLALRSGAPHVTSCRSVPEAIRANTNRRKHHGTL